MRAVRVKRRTFLGLGAGLTVTFLAGCSLPVIPKRPDPTPETALGWIRHRDGRYVLALPRAEIGQNIATALKQVACDELGADWEAVDLQLAATGDIDRVRATVGSESVKDFALPLAQACATLRDAVAAGRTGGTLTAEPRPMSALRAFANDARYVGKPAPLEQADAIVGGGPVYASDVRRPGMAFGRVLRAPASPDLGSRPAAWNEAAARAVPGFVRLVEDPLLRQGRSDGLGIVAETPGALDRVAAALDVRWKTEGGFEQADIDRAIDIDRRLADGALSHSLIDETVDRDVAWDVDLRIDVPLGAHAPIEPRAAVAAFEGDGLRLWVGSQDIFYIRDVMVRRLGLDADEVVVHGQRVGGAFGGKTLCTVELEAAVLARATERPVKVQWTREQEFRQGFHRPPSSHRVRARLKDGQVEDWWHAFATTHVFFTNAGLPPWMQSLTNLIGDGGAARGAIPPYRIAKRRIEHDLERLPVLTGPWRGLGAGPNALAIECAMDECARAAGQDPVVFRLAHIDNPRLGGVLRRVAAEAGWDKPRKGRGIACGIYKEMSYAAVVADVAVGDNSIQVERLWCAHDCGRVINPDQVRAQCEGNLVWGLGMALTDRLPVAADGVAAETFADSPIPAIDQVPPMEILLVDSGEPPTGAGETAIVAASGAILNAIRDATGVRPARLPVTAADLLASNA